jgi:hypothetical protein
VRLNTGIVVSRDRFRVVIDITDEDFARQLKEDDHVWIAKASERRSTKK